MTGLLRRANEQTFATSLWMPPPEGVWRWEILEPDLKFNDKFEKYGIKWTLMLIESERKRLENEHGQPPAGYQQSWRTYYTTGLSLGWTDRDGQYHSTKMVDFMAAALGSRNSKRFRQWVEAGGGPRGEENGLGADEELDKIREWLTWWQGLELLGSIRHEPDAVSPGVVWGRFGGPIAVGSLPGQRDDEYQAIGLGKLRAMILESGGSSPPPSGAMHEVVEEKKPAAMAAPAGKAEKKKEEVPVQKPLDAARYTEIFGDDTSAGTGDEVPF